MLWNSLEPVVVSSNPPMLISCARTFTHICVHQSLLGRSQLHKSSNFCQKTFFKVHGRSSKRISANSRIAIKILCWWMGGLEIKEVWRPSTSCNLFITSFTFRPCLPLVRECIWLNTGSTRIQRRKQDNGSHKKQSNQSLFLCQSLPSHFLAGHIRKVFMTLTHIVMGHSRWRQQETDLDSPGDVCLWRDEWELYIIDCPTQLIVGP